MGFADLLISLGIPYNSEKAVSTGENVMKFIHEQARQASSKLAEERGNFPNYKDSIFNVPEGPPMRNATVTTIAPTGTISIIAGCSSGIEPLFALIYTHNILDSGGILDVHPMFEQTAMAMGFYSPELMERVSQAKSLREIDGLPESVKRLFVVAHDIDPEWHVRMQAAFQRCTDNAVSKTINFRNEATQDDVRKAFLLAHELGVKGVTVYRDGSRANQVLTVGKASQPAAADAPAGPAKIEPRPRPTVTRGATQKIKTGCGNLYITINEDDEGLCELFTAMGKSGGCTASQAEAVSRLVSLALRSGVSPQSLIEQLRGIRCPSAAWDNGGMVLSCPDAIARAIERHLAGNGGNPGKAMTAMVNGSKIDLLAGFCPECPECGSMVERVEGCIVCRACGYSKCP